MFISTHKVKNNIILDLPPKTLMSKMSKDA